jgi:hypothetical protein
VVVRGGVAAAPGTEWSGDGGRGFCALDR